MANLGHLVPLPLLLPLLLFFLLLHQAGCEVEPLSPAATSATIGSAYDRPLPVYYINMEESTERRDAMERMFAGVEHLERLVTSRVSATTASDVKMMMETNKLSFEGINNIVDSSTLEATPLWKLHFAGNFTSKETACAVSHLRAIRAAFEAGHEMALVLEDNVILTNNFVNFWQSHARVAPEDWEVLQFFVSNGEVNTHMKSIREPWISCRPHHLSTSAYLINRSGMNSLLWWYKVGSAHDVWKFREPGVLVANELVYYTTRSYTSTYPLIKMNYNVTNSFRDAKRDYFESELFLQSGKDPLIRGPSLLTTSLLVVTTVAVVSAADVDYEMLQLWRDIRAMEAHYFTGKVHWRIHVAAISVGVANDCKQILVKIVRQKNRNITISSSLQKFATYRVLRDVAPIMHRYDDVLWKEHSYQLVAFPWRTFLEKRETAVVATSLKSNPESEMIRNKHDIGHEGYALFDAIFSIRPFYSVHYSNLQTFHVCMTGHHMSLYDGAFAAWYFNKLLTDKVVAEINRENRESDKEVTMVSLDDEVSCSAAVEWLEIVGNSRGRQPCLLVPLALSMKSRVGTYNNELRASNLSVFAGAGVLRDEFREWAHASAKWRTRHYIKSGPLFNIDLAYSRAQNRPC